MGNDRDGYEVIRASFGCCPNGEEYRLFDLME